MYFWFQNLAKDGERSLFHFRGSVGKDHRRNWFRYEISSGRSLKLEYQHGECCDDSNSSQIVVGFLFATIYFTFYLPSRFYFQRKCVATWDGGREFYLTEGRRYGFYFYDWAFVWSFHAKVNESASGDPWWMHQYIHIDDLLVGKAERLEDRLISAEDIHFKLGGKPFKMDKIEWERNRRFRRFIPYSLYHRTWYSVNLEIKDPPMRAGKGENSWDCGDDGSFGLSGPWKGPPPSWKNRDECTKAAVEYYVQHILKDAARYGSGSGERGVNKNDTLEFIGRTQQPESADSNAKSDREGE